MSKRKQEKDKGKSPKIKRASTMESTASEGNEFLEKEAPELVTVPGKSGVETRGKQNARSTLDSLMNKEKELTELSEVDRKREENKLKMVFRLFDKDKDGFLDADELSDALRSCGKKPVKAKINAILKSVSQNKKGDKISNEEFVGYMMKKMFKAKKGEKEKAKEKEEKEMEKDKEKEKEKEKEAKGKEKSPTKEKKTPTKGKKAAAKATKSKKGEKAGEKEKEAKGKEPEVVPEVVPMERTRSITEFYTEHAGLNTEIVPEKLDKFANPEGAEFDLGQEGAFVGYKILVGAFIPKAPQHFTHAEFEKNPKPPLQAKGFDFIFTSSESEFIESLPKVDIAWIISTSDPLENKAKFVQACREFHESGGGLFLWGENRPFFVHASTILSDLLGVTLTGNTPAHKNLSFGDPTKPGHFGSHLITSGITHLFEGRTVCYPAKSSPMLQTIATSSDNHPVILVAEQGPGGLKPNQGRIVVDCGYTKLFVNWDSAGTARYVVNANVWLLGLDHKLRNDIPLSRVREEIK